MFINISGVFVPLRALRPLSLRRRHGLINHEGNEIYFPKMKVLELEEL